MSYFAVQKALTLLEKKTTQQIERTDVGDLEFESEILEAKKL